MPAMSRASGRTAACDAQARGFRRRQGRARRPQAGRDHRRRSACARVPDARAKRRDPGRHRHRAVGQSAIDLPPAGSVRALAGARGAGCAAARAAGAAVVSTVRDTPTWVFASRKASPMARGNPPATGLPGFSRRRQRRPARSRKKCSRRSPARASPGCWWRAGRPSPAAFVAADLIDEAALSALRQGIGEGIAPLEGMPLDAFTGRMRSLGRERLGADTLETYERR